MAQLISFIIQFLIGFIGISIVLIIHELAHFIAARLLKVNVEEFSIGMGPKIFSFQGKKTLYVLRLLPLGGSTKMNGSTDLLKALRDDAKDFNNSEVGSFFNTSPFRRFIIFISGPFVNILLALFIFIIISYIPVETIVNEPLIVNASDYNFLFNVDVKQKDVLPGDKIIMLDNIVINTFEDAEEYLKNNNNRKVYAKLIRGEEIIETVFEPKNGKFGITLYQRPILSNVDPSSPFEDGDIILSVNGKLINCTYDLYRHCDEVMNITIQRGDNKVIVTLDPMKTFPFAWKSQIVISSKPTITQAIEAGLTRTQSIIRSIISTIINIITGKLTDTRNEITGPTRAATQIGSITTLSFKTSKNTGIRTFLYLLSTVSVSIGVINLLPIPSFDGGQMIINLYQIFFRRQLKPKTYIVFHIIGLIISFIMLFMLYYVDIKFYFS